MRNKLNKILIYIEKIPLNYLIVFLSIFLSLIFIILSWQFSIESRWSNFFISFSASIMAVGVTVMLVDNLRIYHTNKQYNIPKEVALSRIRNVHSRFLLTMLTGYYKNKKDHQFIKDFVNAGIDGLPSLLSKYSKEVLELNPEILFANFSSDEIAKVIKNDVTDLLSRMDRIINKYEFSLLDVELRHRLADLVTSLESVRDSFIILEIEPEEVAKLLIPKTDAKNAHRVMVGSVIKGYIKDYSKFVDDYCGSKKSA